MDDLRQAVAVRSHSLRSPVGAGRATARDYDAQRVRLRLLDVLAADAADTLNQSNGLSLSSAFDP